MATDKKSIYLLKLLIRVRRLILLRTIKKNKITQNRTSKLVIGYYMSFEFDKQVWFVSGGIVASVYK